MKARTKSGAVVATEFDDFADFLRIVGPRPSKAHTLDRINNDDPTYGPGRVRWADKIEQANNRSTTRRLTIGGETLPLRSWAKRGSEDHKVVRRRLARGWSATDAVYGQTRTASTSLNAFEFNPWPLIFPSDEAARQRWERRYLSNVRFGISRSTFLINLLQPKLDAAQRELDAWDPGEGEDDLPEITLLRTRTIPRLKEILFRAKRADELFHRRWIQLRKVGGSDFDWSRLGNYLTD